MTTGNIKIKFLQQPLNNQNFNYVVNKNSVPFQTINKTFKAPISSASNRICKINAIGNTLDTSFNVGTGFNSGGVTIMAAAIQSDGKVLVGGNFTTYNGTTTNRLVRLNTNGSIDTSFNIGTGFNNYVWAIAIQTDGKIIVGGFYSSVNGTSKGSIVRLNANGSIDTSFNSGGSGFNEGVHWIHILPDGKMLVAGQFTNYNGTAKRGLVKLNSNGSIDTSFNSGGTNFGLTFGNAGAGNLREVKLQSDGKIICAGYFDSYNGTTVRGICRLNTNGTLDTSFNSGGAGITSNGTQAALVRSVAILPDDKIIMAGDFHYFNGTASEYIAKCNADGSIDSSFNVGSSGFIGSTTNRIGLMPDNTLFISGNFIKYNGYDRGHIVRIDEDGTYIPDNLSFNNYTNFVLVKDADEVFILGEFSNATTSALSTSTEIPIGSTMLDTMNNTVSNFNTFNVQSDVTYSISGDTVNHKVDYDNTTTVLTVNSINDIPFFVIITFDDGVAEPIGDVIIIDESNPLSPSNILNPAYNNTIIRWQTDISNLSYAEVIAGGIGYKIYPFGNSFTFNFKEIAKNLINQNYFKDTIIPDLSLNAIYDDSTLSLDLPITINVYDTGNEFLTINRTLKFIKSVEQLPNYVNKLANAPAVRTLLPTNNFIDYYLPYFEGFPTDFAVYGLTQNDTYFFKNISNYNQTDTYTGTTNQVKRFYLSDGFSDGSINEDLNLASTQNKLELWVNDLFVNNLIIDKKESKCGVYLRWFNNSGSYSYWLFDEPYQQSTQYRMIDDIQGVYDNLQSITSSSEIIGKNGSRTLRLKTKYNLNQKEYLESLLASPLVEMYAYNKPFASPINTYSFFGVKVNDGSFPFNSKNSNNTLEVTITLPEINTQTL
ncbi:hypothetical protein ABGT15_04500 [Flavobacterium enshiense]|uniref:hypothetical protein n=1 Tax=Flavobacterium enshiense TaxID=1341165 RepID=UPI00345D0EDD